jgi:hypothetical protein
MEHKKKSYLKNKIKIFPSVQPELHEAMAKKVLAPRVKNPLHTINKLHVVSLPKLSRLSSSLYNESKSFNNVLQSPSIFSAGHSLIDPKIKDKRYMMGELEKIVNQCNDNSFKNSVITEQLNRTENEISEIVQRIAKMNEYQHIPKKRFQGAAGKKEAPMNRNSIRELIRNMKRMYIKICAI